VYTYFLLLHVAIRILISALPSEAYLNFTDCALQIFVIRFEYLYDSIFTSYNVHGLTHLINDVRRLSTLDLLSAFPYENNMVMFRKFCRKIQQISNRIAEMDPLYKMQLSRLSKVSNIPLKIVLQY